MYPQKTAINMSVGSDSISQLKSRFEAMSPYSIEFPMKLAELLGFGSFGCVYKALRYGREKPYAMKLFHSRNPEEIILKEIYLMGLLNHKNIISCYYKINAPPPTRELIGFVLEYVDNVPFSRIMAEQDQNMMSSYVYQVLSGLEHCHRLQIIHRDLKPDNILYDRNRDLVKIIDFGLSIDVSDTSTHRLQNSHCGTLCYKSPEQLLGMRMFSYGDDMWSVGCIVASLYLQTQPFFNGGSEFLVLTDILKKVGLSSFVNYIVQFKLPLQNHLRQFIGSNTGYINDNYLELCCLSKNIDPRLIDLLYKLFTYNHLGRIDAKSAMEHAFFKHRKFFRRNH